MPTGSSGLGLVLASLREKLGNRTEKHIFVRVLRGTVTVNKLFISNMTESFNSYTTASYVYRLYILFIIESHLELDWMVKGER